MNEKFLHYIWFKRLFSLEQTTTDGQKIEIIDVGQPNNDAGADVFNAKIKIGDTLWAGNVEFHSDAADWQRHKHNLNKAYDSVILHVVLKAGENAVRTNKTIVPQMVIKYPKHLEEQFEAINLPFIPCAEKLIENQHNNLEKVFEKLLNERLENKLSAIEKLLEQTSGDWEEAFYITTARSFGFGTNADTFETLSRNLPQKLLAKHKDNPVQIEAMLFGVGGFLEKDCEDNYFKTLKIEYQYLKQKYQLQNIEISQWKFLRLRPTNFPTIRIAQFASLIFKSVKLFSKIIEQKNYKNLLEYYDCEPSEYWKTHYLFGKKSEEKGKNISKSSVDILLINSVIPFLYAYGKKFNQKDISDFAFSLLNKIPAEKNRITKGFQTLNINVQNAAQSQALNELKTKYCDLKKCYICKQKHSICATS